MTNMGKASLADLKRQIDDLRRDGKSWRKMSKDVFPGVPAATLCAIHKHGRDPKKVSVRRALGLPIYRLVLECPDCHDVHLSPCPLTLPRY